jgi:HAD superfamily hydrolase (TIGR01509 family)
VLLDWRGVLVDAPPLPWWVCRALEAAGRPATPSAAAPLVDALRRASALPRFVDAEARFIDRSAELHRETSMRLYAEAGLDRELAEAFYAIHLEPASQPVFPEVPAVLRELRRRGVRTAVVSNVHFDVRPCLAAQGVAGLVDAWVLSFEEGVQKPDPRVFRLALERLDVAAGSALMVGDAPELDGAAALAGICTLLLPPPVDGRRCGLDAVLRLLG